MKNVSNAVLIFYMGTTVNLLLFTWFYDITEF